ncbi:adenylate kinase [Flaviflexus equikiangi]|uniref:adenylate kinase n=1 Tax=Flaviflexus equikiangi TaxID=2758573 RepID=UPI0015F487DD|nr:adenylate kinase [Flaviflexus equikiangi]
MTRMIILGAPGAGKGTQAEMLCEKLGIPQISTGAIFRANVAEGTELGQLAQGYINQGKFVPDEITDALVKDRLHQDDTQKGFLLDGYPRTLAQVGALDEILLEQGHTLDIVIELVTDKDALVERLLKRAEIEGRADDTAEVISHRMDVYAEQTMPLSRVYEQRGVLVRVDGMGTIDEVQSRIQDAVQAL